LTAPRRFIVHESFLRQHKEFVDNHPELEAELLSQYRKAFDDPSAGKPMKRIPLEELQGKVFRLRIGGRQRYRLVYVYSKEHGVILPAWISPVARRDLNYDREPWLEYAQECSRDLAEGNTQKFKNLTSWVLSL